MTILQLKTAVTAQECGSIANAAKKLSISQPNASSSIRLLEAEIGFPIFSRTKKGAVPTERGKAFLTHARSILSENEKIMELQNRGEIYRLRLGTVNYSSAIEPFLKLCSEHRDDSQSDFCCYNVSILEGIEKLENYELDLVFAPALKSQLAGVTEACRKKNLELISLGKIPAVISVRKDHPALADGRLSRITQGSDVMKDYPYAAYRNLVQDSSSTGYNDTSFIQCRSVIYVDEVDARLRLVASTNAFSFGIVPAKGVSSRYGLVSFSVPGIFLDIFCIVRKGESDRKELCDYLSLLKAELEL